MINTFVTNEEIKQNLCQLIQSLHQQGKSPATSTNYSFLGVQQEIFVSRSGVDKSQFQTDDFIEVNLEGQSIGQYQGIKPSAETLIHCFLYQHFPDTTCILHTHSLASTILSALSLEQQKISFTGYEVIKGIQGYQTHATTIDLPIFANEQDMQSFCQKLLHRQLELKNYGFLIAQHGLYAWGKDLAEAKRHLEVWEFMLECELELLKLQRN